MDTKMTDAEALAVLERNESWIGFATPEYDEYRAALAHLSSRLVAGEDARDSARYRFVCDRHPLAFQRLVAGKVENGPIYRKDLIDAAIDADIDAAPKREGDGNG